MNNMLLNPMSNKEINDAYIKCLKLEEENYNIKIKKLKPYQISIECENQFDYLSTHQYSITLSYDEFCKLGKTFRLSDNIDEIFDTIKNLFFNFSNCFLISLLSFFNSIFIFSYFSFNKGIFKIRVIEPLVERSSFALPSVLEFIP